MRKLKYSLKAIIRKANKIHNNKYDYSKTKHVKIKDKITIICPLHGEFEQIAQTHLAGHGCPKCSGKHQYTTEEFIEKAKEVHEDKYDYSKTKYINTKSKIIIICPLHGEFQQITANHLKGSNCPRCSGLYNFTTEEYIEKVKEVHEDKYDYSKTKYINHITKVTIICPEHGEFQQMAGSHSSGKGCSKCAGNGFKFKTLPEVMKIIKPLNLKSQPQYLKWWRENRVWCQENGIPSDPYNQYIKK